MNNHSQDVREPAGVILSAEDVRDAVRLLERLAGMNFQPAVAQSSGTDVAAPIDELSIAQLSILNRENRAQFFPWAMFGEPAWDLLLALYMEEESGGTPTVSSLSKLTRTPVTTALRWIDYLEEKGFVSRGRSSIDRRASTVSLSLDGRSRLQRYFADVVRRLTRRGLALVASTDPGPVSDQR